MILINIDTFITLLLWLQFHQRYFIIIALKLIKITVFKLNMKKLIPSKLKTQSWQVSRDILTLGKIFLVIDSSISASVGIAQKMFFWRATDLPLIPSFQNVVILCGTINVNKDPPYDIVQGLIVIGSVFKRQSSKSNISNSGISSLN